MVVRTFGRVMILEEMLAAIRESMTSNSRATKTTSVDLCCLRSKAGMRESLDSDLLLSLV